MTMIPDERALLQSIASAEEGFRLAKEAADLPALRSLLERGLIAVVEHPFGEHVVVVRITASGQRYLHGSSRTTH